MYQTITQLANMPLHLACLSNGLIAFTRSQHFSTIYESCEGYDVYIDEEGIKFVGESLPEPLFIEYNNMTDFRDKPVLVKWLQSMQLTQPTQPTF